MPNMKTLISRSNQKKLSDAEATITTNVSSKKGNCNCDVISNCPLQGECKTECVVYNAKVITDQVSKNYKGMTERSFKTRWNEHNFNFAHENYKSCSELAEFIWKLKNEGIRYKIEWSILEKTPKLRQGQLFCPLCVAEKRHILFSDPNTLINSRDEFVSKCRHQLKFTFHRYKYDKNIDLLKHTETDDNLHITQTIDRRKIPSRKCKNASKVEMTR